MPGQRGTVVRDTELGQMVALLDRAIDGAGNVSVVDVTGDSGLGKTRLLAELAEHASERGITAFVGQCNEDDQDVAFRPFSVILGHQLMRAHLARLPFGQARLLKAILSRDASHTGGWASGQDQRLALTAFRTLLNERAGSLLIILDDFHWADPASVALIEHLVRWPVRGRLLLVIAHRPPLTSPQLHSTLAHGAEIGTVKRISLSPLTIDQSARMLGRSPADATLQRLQRDSDGNPLYLLALASSQADETATDSQLESAEIPDQVTHLVTSELARLPSTAVTVAEGSAVLDAHADVTSLAAVTGLDHKDVCAAIDLLTHRDLLRLAADGSLRVTFRHAVIRKVVYASTRPGWRFLAHRRAFEVLRQRDADAISQAHHIIRSQLSPDTSAVALSVLARAAGDAFQTDPAGAENWLRHAVNALPAQADPADQIVELVMRLAGALIAVGELAEASDLVLNVLRLAPPPPGPDRVSAVTLGAVSLSLQGKYQDATELVDNELAAMPAELAGLRAELATVHGKIWLAGGGLPESSMFEAACRVAYRRGDQRVLAGAQALYGLSLIGSGDARRASRILAECARTIDDLSDADLAGSADYLSVLGWSENVLGRFVSSELHLRRAITVAQADRCAPVLAVSLAGLSTVLRFTGRLPEGIQAAHEAQGVARRMHADHVYGLTLVLESLCRSAMDGYGDHRAESLAQQATAKLLPGSCAWSINASVALALAVSASGDSRRSMQILLSAGGGAGLNKIPLHIRPICFEMLTALAVDSDHGQAAEWADRASADADTLGLQADRAYAQRARAHLLRVRLDPAATAAYLEAAQSFGNAGSVIEQATSLVSGARCAIASNDLHQASEMLEVADRLATEKGIRRLSEEVDELSRSLAQPDPAGAITPSVLTTREQDIARLAADGKRTREIAGELALSPRTVDSHLARIYRKLDVRGRAELAKSYSNWPTTNANAER